MFRGWNGTTNKVNQLLVSSLLFDHRIYSGLDFFFFFFPPQENTQGNACVSRADWVTRWTKTHKNTQTLCTQHSSQRSSPRQILLSLAEKPNPQVTFNRQCTQQWANEGSLWNTCTLTHHSRDTSSTSVITRNFRILYSLG